MRSILSVSMLLFAALVALACSTGAEKPSSDIQVTHTDDGSTSISSPESSTSTATTVDTAAATTAAVSDHTVTGTSSTSTSMSGPPGTEADSESAASSTSSGGSFATSTTRSDSTQTSSTSTAPDSTSAESSGGASGSTDVLPSDSASSGEVLDPNGDLTPPRPLNVTAAKAKHDHRFRAATADPTVGYNDNDEIALFDNRAATLMGKLVLTFGGAGETKGNLTGAGEFCAKRGFHVLAVAAFQAYNIVDYGPDFFGEARRTVFEGVMYTKQDAFANITLTPADGVVQRTQKALQYLHATYPEEDWGYYLQEDGSVRWSDVIFTGVSHGASNSARFASLVRAARVVAVAGPRDNLCARVDLNDCGGEVATWYDEVPKTPVDRYYTITGVQDDQHTQHLFAMEKLGYVGEPTRVDGAQAPYGGSHRLIHSGGHDDVCTNQTYQDLCNYVFGVPEENHAGTGP